MYWEPESYLEYRESLQYSLYRTHNSLSLYHFRTRGIFRTLSNIYNGAFCSEPCVTLTYLEPWHIQNLRNIENSVKHLWWNVLSFRTLCNYNIFRLLIHSKPWHIQNSGHSRYRESLKYNLQITLCNLDIFTTYVYSSPGILRTRGMWWAIFYGTLCNTGIFRTQGIFRALSNIYDGEFY